MMPLTNTDTVTCTRYSYNPLSERPVNKNAAKNEMPASIQTMKGASDLTWNGEERMMQQEQWNANKIRSDIISTFSQLSTHTTANAHETRNNISLISYAACLGLSPYFLWKFTLQIH